MLALEKYVANSRLEHTLYELVKARASQINKCGYCLDMHTKDDRKAKSDIINEDEFKKILKKTSSTFHLVTKQRNMRMGSSPKIS